MQRDGKNLLAGLLLAACTTADTGVAQSRPSRTASAGVTDLKPVLQPTLERSHAPALAAAVYRDGKLIALGVCGVRSLENKEAVTPDDRFPILSCSKPFARLLLARLAERGLVRFDTPLAKSLPGVEMRPEYRDVTLSNLMAHTAGIQPYTEIGPRRTPILFENNGTPRQQRARFAAHVLNEEPAAPPRTRFVYSNAGFAIAAAVAEQAAGKDWETLMADEVFGPLGLRSATEAGDGVLIHGHQRTPEGPKPVAPFGRLPAMAPAGGVCLNIADFAAFAAAEADVEAGRAVMGLSEKTLHQLPELRPADSAPPGRGGSLTFGGDGQYHAAFATWPKQRAAIAVACNLGDSDELCTEIAAAVRAAVAPDLEPGDTAPGGGPGADGPRYGYMLRMLPDGVEINGVTPGSIADKAGLREGDKVLKINGVATADIAEDERMRQLRASPLKLVVSRGGKEIEIELRK